MPATLRTAATAFALGAAGWLLFMAVALGMGGAATPAIDPAALYPPEWSFAADVLLRSLVLCASVALVAWLLTRRDEPVGRVLCAGAAVLLVVAWASRSGASAAALGLGADAAALAAATAPHAAAELALITLPLTAAARGHAVGAGWMAAAGAGLAACAVVEAFL